MSPTAGAGSSSRAGTGGSSKKQSKTTRKKNISAHDVVSYRNHMMINNSNINYDDDDGLLDNESLESGGDGVPPPPPTQQSFQYKNIPVPPPPTSARPRLSPIHSSKKKSRGRHSSSKASRASHDNSRSSSPKSRANSKASKQNKASHVSQKRSSSSGNQPVISPPSHAFLFKDNNISPTAGGFSARASSPILCGVSGFGGALPQAHHAAAPNNHSRMKSPPPPLLTDDICQEEEEVYSPSNNGRLIVPFAQTSEPQDATDDRAVLSVPVQEQQQDSMYAAHQSGGRSNLLMTSSTTAILSANTCSAADAAASTGGAGGDTPLFGTKVSSSSVSSSMPGIYNNNSNNNQNDPRQANLQLSKRGGGGTTSPSFQVLGIAEAKSNNKSSKKEARRDRSDKSTKYYNETAKTSVPTIAPTVSKASRPPSVVTAASNSTSSSRRATLDSTVAAAAAAAAAAGIAATAAAKTTKATTTPHNATACSGAGFNTSCSDVYTTTSSEAAASAKRQQQTTTPHTTMSSGWTSLIMGAQTYDSSCCGPDDLGDEQNDDSKRLLPNNDVDPSSSVVSSPVGANYQQQYRQAPTDILSMGQHSILDQNGSTSNDDDDDNSDASSFNDESSMMHGNEGDGIVNLSAFGSSLNKKSSRRDSAGTGGTHSSTAGKSSRSVISEWAQYTRRRRMIWIVLFSIALMTLLILAIVIPRNAYGKARQGDNVNSNNDSVHNPDLSSAPTVAPSAVTKPDSLPTNGGGTAPSEIDANSTNIPDGDEIITTSSPAVAEPAAPSPSSGKDNDGTEKDDDNNAVVSTPATALPTATPPAATIEPSSPQPTPELINDTPTSRPTLSPSAKEVDATEILNICFADAATLPLDSSILQASLLAPNNNEADTENTSSSNNRPTYPFCDVPPNPDWSPLIRFGPQQWFSLGASATLPALVEICMDQTTHTIVDDNDKSDSPIAPTDSITIRGNLNFARPFLVIFHPGDTEFDAETSCEQVEEDLECQAATDFIVPGNPDGEEGADNHDFDMIANDMYDAEMAEFCQSVYYPGADNGVDGQELLLLAGVYGYSHRVDDILTVDFTISAKTNDQCGNAVPFALAASESSSSESGAVIIQGTTEGIVENYEDMDLPPCGSAAESESVPGVWYQIYGTGETIRLQTCASAVENIITVYTTTITDKSNNAETVCEHLQCISDDEQSQFQEQACPGATGGGGNSIVFTSQVNQVYFVRVHAAASASNRALSTAKSFTEEQEFTPKTAHKHSSSRSKGGGKKQHVAAQEKTSVGGPFELSFQETTVDDTSGVIMQSLGLCMAAEEIVLGTEQVHLYSWLASRQDKPTPLSEEGNSGQAYESLCNDQIAITLTGPAKWFSFVGNGEEVYFNTCSDPDDDSVKDFQSILSVFSGSCGDELACVDTTSNIASARAAGFRCSSTSDSHISFVSEQGKLYYVAVHGVNGGFGDFRLKFGYASCLMLGVPLEKPMRATGEVRVGLLSNEPQSHDLVVMNNVGEQQIMQGGRFFAYYGTGGIMIASTCNGITDFNAQLTVYSGKCSAPVQIAHYESPISCARGREIFWRSEAGQYYYVHVTAKNMDEVQASSSSLGRFGLVVNAGGGDVCATAFGPVVPAVGDDQQVELNYWALEGWTVPTLVEPIKKCGPAAASERVHGKWYKTTGTGSTMEWYTSFPEAEEGSSISVFRGNCGDLECVDFDDHDGSVVWKSNSGETYYILVASSLEVLENEQFSVFVKQWNNVCEFTTESEFQTLPTDGTVIRGRTMGWSESTFSPPTPTITYVSRSAVSELENDGRNAWYTVVGEGSALVASACSRSIGESSLEVLVLEEHSPDSGCNDLVGVSSQATVVSDNGVNCSVSWQAEAGKVYRLVLRAAQQTDRGRFGISVMESGTQG